MQKKTDPLDSLVDLSKGRDNDPERPRKTVGLPGGDRDPVSEMQPSSSSHVSRPRLRRERFPMEYFDPENIQKKRNDHHGGRLERHPSVVREGPHFNLARRVAPTKDILQYRVLRVINPFEIYMVLEEDITNGLCFQRCGGFIRLQEVVKNLERKQSPLQPLSERELIKNKMYIIYDHRSIRWHRCRLVNFDFKSGQGVVYYFDYYLELEKVALSELREMPIEIAEYPIAPVYRCHLYDVIPKGGGHQWNLTEKENQRLFSFFPKQKCWTWMVMQMTWNEKRVGDDDGSDLVIDLGVVMFQKTESVWDGSSLNAKLVELTIGKSIGVGATYFTNLFMDYNEPMFSMHEAPNVKYPESFSMLMPYDAGSRLPRVTLRHVRGLDCIYVFLINKYGDLRAMEHFMENYLKEKETRHVEEKDIKPGLPVVIKVHNPKTGTITPGRAFILEILEKHAMVLMVDNGKKIRVSLRSIYSMPKRLCDIPAFVHRIHLCNIRPIPTTPFQDDYSHRTSSWPKGHEKSLSRFLKSFMNESKPAFFAIRPQPEGTAGVIEVQKIHQGLACRVRSYNISEWTPELLYESRDNYPKLPLIESHYYSFGVDLVFLRDQGGANDGVENKDGKEMWKFESLGPLIAVDGNVYQAEIGDRQNFDKKSYYENVLARFNV